MATVGCHRSWNRPCVCKLSESQTTERPGQPIVSTIRPGGCQRMFFGRDGCAPWFLTREVEPVAGIFLGPESGCRPGGTPKWGEDPMADTALPGLFYHGRHKKISPDQKPAGVARPAMARDLSQNEIGFAPPP